MNATFEDLCEQHDHLETLKKTSLLSPLFPKSAPHVSKKQRKARARAGPVAKGKKPAEPTIVTPTVYGIARKIFDNHLRVVDMPGGQRSTVPKQVPIHPQHDDIIKKIRWVGAENESGHYDAVLLDGVRYEVRTR